MSRRRWWRWAAGSLGAALGILWNTGGLAERDDRSSPAGGGPSARPAAPSGPAVAAAPISQLTPADVDAIVRRATEAVEGDTMVVVVTDRLGQILAVYRKPGATMPFAEVALGLARTAAFFSNDQAPLSSRTVRFISGIHFPPGVRNTPNGALYGIENTNRGYNLNVPYLPGRAFPPATSLAGTAPGPGIVTGKVDVQDSDARAVNPGGVPIFREGHVVGGVGVAGVPGDRAEFAAYAGSFGPTQLVNGRVCVPAPPLPRPGVIFIDGIELPFVLDTCRPPNTGPGTFAGSYDTAPAPGQAAPEGDLMEPRGSAELTAAEVRGILDRAEARARRTRAAIRLPLSQPTRMVLAVGDLQGNVLGLRRMEDSTVFSVDVAITKARNVVYFSSADRAPEDLPGVEPGTAVTNRTISFGAQPFFPPGIEQTAPGTFFELFQYDTAHPGTQGRQPANPNQSGIVFFPGSVPLYKAGALVGGLGVSGDGVEQDDYVSAAGAQGFEPPPAIRADRFFIKRVRLPYLKFPRRPEVGLNSGQ
jgi:uncharacterized protein GlcG (DUF336 family)